MSQNSVDDCLSFFQKAVPDPVEKNITTQLGVHFEEVAEMLDTMTPLSEETGSFVNNARDAIHWLAEHLKTNVGCVRVASEDRVDFLDALCDQIVTAIGCAHMHEMNIIDGFNEVNASNLSKFDEHGEPIFDNNMKVTKGPRYFKAQLEPFV